MLNVDMDDVGLQLRSSVETIQLRAMSRVEWHKGIKRIFEMT